MLDEKIGKYFLVTALACRGCCIVIVFMTTILLSLGIHGASYAQAKTMSCGEDKKLAGDSPCRMIFLNQTQYIVNYSAGGGQVVDVGRLSAQISANYDEDDSEMRTRWTTDESGVNGDEEVDESGVNGDEEVDEEEGDEEVMYLCTLELPKDPQASVVCEDCNVHERYRGWSNSVKVGDLPNYCKDLESGGQKNFFTTQPDTINGFLFFVPILVWFVLRVLGVALEIHGIQHPGNGGALRGLLVWLGCSVVPGVCLKPFTVMTASASTPGVMFASVDNHTLPFLYAYMIFFGVIYTIYECVALAPAPRPQPHGLSPTAQPHGPAPRPQPHGKISDRKLKYFGLFMLFLLLPVVGYDIVWMLGNTVWTLGFSLHFAISYPGISFNRTLSVFNVVAFCLFMLDSLAGALKFWKKLHNTWKKLRNTCYRAEGELPFSIGSVIPTKVGNYLSAPQSVLSSPGKTSTSTEAS